MAREEIDLKSIKKLNNNGKPKKSMSSANSKFAKKSGSGKPKAGKSDFGKSNYGKNGAGKSTYKKQDAASKAGVKPATKKTEKGNARSEHPIENVSVKAFKKVPEEWLYLSKEENGVKLVKEACESLGFNVEFWPEIGVIEVGVDEVTNMDFEQLELAEADDFSREYCEQNGIVVAMVVSVQGESLGGVKDTMKKISAIAGGFFCVDDGAFEGI